MCVITVPDEKTLKLLTQRKTEVEQTKLVQRAMALPRVDKHAVRQALCLLVVREFGLPDSAANALLDTDCPWQEDRTERVIVPCHIHRSPHWRSPEVMRSPRLQLQQQQSATYHHHHHHSAAQAFCPIHDRYQVILRVNYSTSVNAAYVVDKMLSTLVFGVCLPV
jgi:hypothetical protein